MQNGLQQLLELLQCAAIAHFTNAVPFAHTAGDGLMSPCWEPFYKRSSCETLTRVGSDHCLFLVIIDDHKFKQQHCFKFEMA
jgi:hypothetical protein